MADMTTKIITIELEADKAVNGIINLNDAISKNNQQIKDNNAAIAANNKAMKENGADVMKLTAQNQKLAQSNVELDAKTKVLKDEKRTLQREMQNEIKLQTQEEGSLRQLRAELSNLTKQYDSLSRSERENANVGGKLKTQINQVTTEIKAAEEGTQRYYRNVGNYQNSILSALGINNQFARSLMGLAATEGGVNAAMASMGASVKAFTASLTAMLANPVFLALAGIAGTGLAFKWWYDYNNELGEATRLTREFTGYTGDALTGMRTSIMATADVMDKEYLEVLKAVDALMAHFHITGKEAMDIINQGFAAGADLNGDFLGKIQQLAPTFHDAGIAADEMVAIMAQTRSGIFSEQGLEAIKQGSARIREMATNTRDALEGIGINVNEMQEKMRNGTMSTFDAIKQVSAQLKTLPNDAQEVGEVMSAVFGRQGKFASQEMIESLADMSTSLDEVSEKTGQYGELLLENIETEEQLDAVTNAMMGAASEGWDEMKQKAIIFVKKGIVAVVKGVVDVVNWFVKLYNKSLEVRAGTQAVIFVFKELWAAAKFALRTIVFGFKNIGRMITAFVDAWNAAGKAVKDVGEGIAEIFKGIVNLSWDTIVSGAGKIADAVSQGTSAVYNALANAFTEAINEMGDMWGDFAAETVENAQDMVEGINSQLQEVSVDLSGYTNMDGGAPTAATSASNSNKSKGGKTGTTKSKGGAAKNTGKSEAEKAEEERQKRLQALIKKGTELELKSREEELRATEEGIIELYKKREDAINAEYAAISTKSTAEAEALMKAKEAVLNANVEAMNKDLQAFRDKQAKAQADATKKAEAEAKAMVQAMISGLPEGSYMQKEWQLEMLRMQMESELAMYEHNEQMKLAIQSKYGMMMQQVEQQYAQKQIAIQQEKYNAIAGIVGGLGEVFGEFGEDSREAAMLQKTLALGEIMIAQAVAIANAIKAGSFATNPWQMIAQIATSVTAVVTAMIQAFKSLNSAKFATGGYIEGAGTSTSDSIPVRVSNGESIMNANTTAMFGGLLSSLNQLGGGVPIQVQESAANVRGEDMLARAFARGVAMLPNPVVSVEDINRGQRQVEVMNERATL